MSCCSNDFLTCNLVELVAPPDARVPMVDGLYPYSNIHNVELTATGCEPTYLDLSPEVVTACNNPYLYECNGILYIKRTVQYAKADRPIIRRADSLYGQSMSISDMHRQFTIDPAIPAEEWMQPVSTAPNALKDASLRCIPAKQFDFKKAKKRPYQKYTQLCALPYEPQPGTTSLWRTIVGLPLFITDTAANIAFFVTESGYMVTRGLLKLPFANNTCLTSTSDIPE